MARPAAFKDADFEQYRLIHRAMNREVDAIVRMLEALAPLDRTRPRRLREWLRFVERTFAHHHVVEDRWFFPLLQQRDPTFAVALAELEREHATLDPLLQKTLKGLNTLPTVSDADWPAAHAELVEVARALRTELDNHLKHEEDEVIPRSVAYLRRVDLDTFNRKAFRAIPVQDVRTTVPWLLDACSEEERRRAVERMPLGMRLVYRFFWGPSFNRRIAPLRG